MLSIFRYLKGFKKQLIIGPAFKLTEAILELIVPLVMAMIIDVGVKNGDTAYVIKMGLIMVLLGGLGLICALICQYNAAKASQGFGTIVRSKMFAHINTLSAREVDKFGASPLITRLTNDVNQLQLAVAMLIRLVVRAPFLVIGAAGISCFIDLKLSLIFFASMPFLVAALYFIMSRSVPLFKKVQQGLDRIALITRENLAGVRVVRAFLGQKKEIRRFNETSDELKTAAVRVGRISALLSPITYVIMNVAILFIIWLGGYRVFDGGLQQGEIIALVQYMTQILLALTVVADLVVVFTKASASARRVNEVFDTQPSLIESSTADTSLTLAASDEIISFQGVSFSYGGDGDNALEDISFTIKKGQTIGIIGGTGSGKSTLVKLMARLYDPTKGNVLLCGRKVTDFAFEQLHKAIAMVPQKAVLFSGTLRENLLWGNSTADEARLYRALSIAQASDFVEKLSGKLDSHISAGGKNLSGGQRQRITIARALTGTPSVLILDDSSSALDYATDAALRSAIARECGDMAVVLVSQRAVTLKSCDFIIVLEDGKIAGIGGHEQLLNTCSEYKEICASQEAVQNA